MTKDWSGNGKSTFITIGASNHTDKEREEHDWSTKTPDSLKERVNNFLCRDFYQKYNIKEGGL